MIKIVRLLEKNLSSAGKIDLNTYKTEEKNIKDLIKKEHKSFNYDGAEEILNVKHLKQFFRYGRGIYKYTKAVHDVSFKVYKGEVFGLVGESGCGKTTTGRSIIKLYRITSGDVFFKGTRIAAGTRWNEKEIKYTNIRLNKKLKLLNEEQKKEISLLSKDDPNYNSLVKEIKDRYASFKTEETLKAKEICDFERNRIITAKRDDKNCDKLFSQQEVLKVEEKYASFLDGYYTRKLNQELTKEDKSTFEKYEHELKEARRSTITSKIQMIFQDPIASLNPRMNVGDIIAEGLVIRGIKDKTYIRKKVSEMLELVGLLPEHMNRYPHEFSGGQRQRIGIARALIMNPELVIADEPVSALDVSIQAQVINLLNDLREKFGLTILFIAHNLSVVKYFCDRIAVMYYGEIVELATSEELFKNPLHPYTKSLLSAVPTPDPNVEKGRVRVKYNPREAHDYSNSKPTLREVAPNHFVLCDDAEEARYKKEIN